MHTMQEQLNAFLRQHSVLPASDRATNIRSALDIIHKAKTFQTTPYKAWTDELKRYTRRETHNTTQKLLTKVPPSFPPKAEPERKPSNKKSKKKSNKKSNKKTNKETTKEPNQEPNQEPVQVQAINDNPAQVDKVLVESSNIADDLDYVVCDAEPSANCTIL